LLESIGAMKPSASWVATANWMWLPKAHGPMPGDDPRPSDQGLTKVATRVPVWFGSVAWMVTLVCSIQSSVPTPPFPGEVVLRM